MTKFSFVSAERANHAVATLCRVVGASVSGFYAWLRAIPAVQHRAEAEAELRRQIGRVFAAGESMQTCGVWSGSGRILAHGGGGGRCRSWCGG